jgi:hypothetical protein
VAGTGSVAYGYHHGSSQAATQSYSGGSYQKPRSGKGRIDTAQCRDNDDWYLDGYRVGKSFRSQKQQMYTHRLNRCNFTTKSLPNQFKRSWENGFKSGIK